jgi:hypothetical protein
MIYRINNFERRDFSMAERHTKKLPYKGINTEKNNGLTDTQEVLWAKEFKRATKAGYPDEVKSNRG